MDPAIRRLNDSEQRLRELVHALEEVRRARGLASVGDAAPTPRVQADVRPLTDRERAVLALRYTPDGRLRRGSCAAAAARLRVSQARVAQISTSATTTLVGMARARRIGLGLPPAAEADLARFAGLTARWWPAASRRLATGA